MAYALGMSKSELHRWKQLAELSAADFEARLARQLDDLRDDRRSLVTASSVLADSTPVPAPGRVQRAASIVRVMTPDERAEFLLWLEGNA